jgi:hypothetical protein
LKVILLYSTPSDRQQRGFEIKINLSRYSPFEFW